MKKTLLLCTLFLCSLIMNAQENIVSNEDSKSQNFNEAKINGLLLVAGIIEVTYERTLNEESSLGVSFFLPIEEDIKEDIGYSISPYYRMYFGEKYASGFFIEGFGMLSTRKDYDATYIITEGIPQFFKEEINVTDFALGIGLGGKWITKNGLIGEVNFGIGRNLFNTNHNNDLVPRIGINVGYRF